MDRFFTDMKYNFFGKDIVGRLILINCAVFVFVELVGVFLMLFNVPYNPIALYLSLPASFGALLYQPWSLITYMFMHAGIFHLLFNMLWLYWFGRLFLNFYSSKHLRGLYILGGLCGGLLYMISYNVFPYFEGSLDIATLVGASASVLAIVVATAVREPEFPVQFMFIGTVRLKYVALFMVLLDLMFMTSGNAGGHIAHLGGAAAGFWFSLGLAKGNDATKWINAVLDFFSGGFKMPKRKPKMKVHYGDRQQQYDYNARKKANEDEINSILEKLKKSGYGSLSDDEKKKLFDASRR
ncbi:rhomboid family intramembrane serine protease [Bacteroides caecigallinarum]|uniref:rhomboid family intramembrane serine protease n=1 Tax=Bacteroides caecigallinarum TaxID=1411144 RepID=UPI00195E5C04|nr:rhomboid family intramembrane serine protease [Bacteroides caecigallinarum]MBM6890413.1 rhomboid family intramembrane serine protease [Bacteroides caecigallinarum]